MESLSQKSSFCSDWKGAPHEYLLERHCYRSTLATFRCIGRGPYGMHVKASLLYKPLRYVPVYRKGAPASMLQRPCTNLLGTFRADCKG